MQVEDSTLERAVFKVFQSQRLAADQSLNFTDLQDAWYQTGLRVEDLRDAVRVLLERGFITVDGKDNTMFLNLTVSGARRAKDSGIHLRTLSADLRDTVTLLRARRRRSGANAALSQGRRHSDAA